MSKFNLITSLQLDATEMDQSMRAMIAQVQAYADVHSKANEKVKSSFRDVATMGVAEMRKEIMQLSKLSFAGKTPEEINMIKNRIGLLRDEMGDLKSEMLIMGGETSTAMVQGLQIVSAGVEGVVGTLSILGVESETIKELEKKMTSMIAVTQALGVVEDYVSSGKLRAIGLKLKDTAVTIGNTIATKAAAVAQMELNAAQKASIYGAIALGVAALAAGIYYMIEAQRESLSLSEEEQAKLKAVNNYRLEYRKTLEETEKAAFKSYTAQKLEIEKLIKVVNDETSSLGEKKKALDTLIALDPSYLQGLNQTNLATDEGRKIIDNYIAALTQKAKAQAYEAQLSDLYLKQFTKEQEIKNAEIGLEVKNIQLLNYTKSRTANPELFAEINGFKKRREEIDAQAADVAKLKEENELLAKSIELTTKEIEKNTTAVEFNTKTKSPGGAAAKTTVPTIDVSSMIDFSRDLNPTPAQWKDIESSLNEGLKDLNIEPIPLKLKLLPVVPKDSMDGITEQMGNMAGAMSGFFDQQSDEYKAFATTQALISTFLAATAVMANQAKLGPIAMGIAFASTIATGMAAVAKIQGFADGGIVQGMSFSGDKIPIRVNSGEMILNKAQQGQLFAMANGAGGMGGGEVTFRIEDKYLVGILNKYSKKVNRTR